MFLSFGAEFVQPRHRVQAVGVTLDLAGIQGLEAW